MKKSTVKGQSQLLLSIQEVLQYPNVVNRLTTAMLDEDHALEIFAEFLGRLENIAGANNWRRITRSYVIRTKKRLCARLREPHCPSPSFCSERKIHMPRVVRPAPPMIIKET